MNRVKDFILLFRIYYYLPSIIVNIVDRIEALEQRHTPEGYKVCTVHVPEGMSTEVAWEEYKGGNVHGRTGRKVRVLVDDEETMLAELKS